MRGNAINHISMKTVWDKPHVDPEPSMILHDEKQPQRRRERRGKRTIVFLCDLRASAVPSFP